MKKRVIALGFFDGVHIGHGELLKRCISVARSIDATPAVMTYSRHPSHILGPSPVKLINTTEERCLLISELYGISDIIVREFTKEYSSLSCEEFIRDVIASETGACRVVAGFDFRFGKNGAGDAHTLSALCREHGIGCDIIDEVSLGGEAVSSSRIRKCIAGGDMEAANELLGHRHCIMTKVTHGARLGGKMGFPTANQDICAEVQTPRHGVYLSRVRLGKTVYAGVTNIGVRPTVSDVEKPRAETHIIGYSGDLYGKTVKLELVKFLRDEMKFSSVAELRERIGHDVKLAEDAARRHF